jgi:hypothetical protein
LPQSPKLRLQNSPRGAEVMLRFDHRQGQVRRTVRP